MSVESLVRQQERQLNCSMENTEESVMRAVVDEFKIEEGEETESRLDKWTEKVVYGQLSGRRLKC